MKFRTNIVWAGLSARGGASFGHEKAIRQWVFGDMKGSISHLRTFMVGDRAVPSSMNDHYLPTDVKVYQPLPLLRASRVFPSADMYTLSGERGQISQRSFSAPTLVVVSRYTNFVPPLATTANEWLSAAVPFVKNGGRVLVLSLVPSPAYSYLPAALTMVPPCYLPSALTIAALRLCPDAIPPGYGGPHQPLPFLPQSHPLAATFRAANPAPTANAITAASPTTIPAEFDDAPPFNPRGAPVLPSVLPVLSQLLSTVRRRATATGPYASARGLTGGLVAASVGAEGRWYARGVSAGRWVASSPGVWEAASTPAATPATAASDATAGPASTGAAGAEGTAASSQAEGTAPATPTVAVAGGRGAAASHSSAAAVTRAYLPVSAAAAAVGGGGLSPTMVDRVVAALGPRRSSYSAIARLVDHSTRKDGVAVALRRLFSLRLGAALAAERRSLLMLSDSPADASAITATAPTAAPPASAGAGGSEARVVYGFSQPRSVVAPHAYTDVAFGYVTTATAEQLVLTLGNPSPSTVHVALVNTSGTICWRSSGRVTAAEAGMLAAPRVAEWLRGAHAATGPSAAVNRAVAAASTTFSPLDGP